MMKTLNPNPEIRNKPKIQMFQCLKRTPFSVSNFEFRICLDFRYSNLGFARNGVPR
jgi:hypothetical protein